MLGIESCLQQKQHVLLSIEPAFQTLWRACQLWGESSLKVLSFVLSLFFWSTSLSYVLSHMSFNVRKFRVQALLSCFLYSFCLFCCPRFPINLHTVLWAQISSATFIFFLTPFLMLHFGVSYTYQFTLAKIHLLSPLSFLSSLCFLSSWMHPVA